MKKNKYTLEELLAFVNRVDSMEKMRTASKFIDNLDISDEWREILGCELQATGDMLSYPELYGRDYDYYDEDRGSYSPSAPWNAPGMRVSDFITGVVY